MNKNILFISVIFLSSQNILLQGTHKILFDGTNYSSGVYYYRLVVVDNTNNGGYTETKKMILIK